MSQKSTKEYEKIGRIVSSIAESGSINRKALYKTAFIKGVIGGFGGVVGATVVLVVAIWLLSLLSEVPLVGRLFENLQSTVETRQ